MATRTHVVCRQDGARAQLVLNAEIKLICVRPLHVWIGVPIKAGEWGWASNRWARARGRLRRTWITATELAGIRPGPFIVLSALSDSRPIVVEPAISGTQDRSM